MPVSYTHLDVYKRQVRDWTDEEAVEAYLRALLHREAFDRAGLIYGMGHEMCIRDRFNVLKAMRDKRISARSARSRASGGFEVIICLLYTSDMSGD